MQNNLTESQYEGKYIKGNFLEETAATFFAKETTLKQNIQIKEDFDSRKNKIVHLMADQMKQRADIRTTARILRRQLGITTSSFNRSDRERWEEEEVEKFKSKLQQKNRENFPLTEKYMLLKEIREKAQEKRNRREYFLGESGIRVQVN